MTKPLQIIFFDAAGTLLHLPRGVSAHYREVALRHGFAPDVAVLGRAFTSAFRTLPPPVTTRAPRPDDDRFWWRALVDRVLDETGAPENFDRQAYFDELYREFTLPGVWALYPEAAEVLAHLAGRCRLGIISNFDARLRTVLGHLGIAELFEVVVISSEVGADKPDPWIFQRALEMAGVAPGAALHVGDDPECDWEAAEAAGMQVFQLERPRNSLTDLAGAVATNGPLRGRAAL
jgi:putative hydrolase of the HAD superfamily